MKNKTIKTAFGSLAIAGALLIAPSVFADTATSTATSTVTSTATSTGSFSVKSNGTVHVKNAEVTSLSGDIISAITRFANLVTSWTFTTNASTTIGSNNEISTSTANIHVGDRINVVGALTSIGSTISVNATKIIDMTSFALFKTKNGTVQSVNTTDGTLVIKLDNRNITVQTNASTTFSVIPNSTSTATTTTLAGITVNSKVTVAGTFNADKTILTATKVIVSPVKIESISKVENKKEDRKDIRKENKRTNNGAQNGLKNGLKDKEDRANSGEHKGFLKVGVGANINLDDEDEDD